MKKTKYNQLIAKNAPLQIGNGHITKKISYKAGGKRFQKELLVAKETNIQMANQDNEHCYPGHAVP